MGVRIRHAVHGELTELSELCLRSKAVWGYDAAFMEACRAELTLHTEDLRDTSVAVAECAGAVVGVAQVARSGRGDAAKLLKLFVAPDRLGNSVGRALMSWAMGEAGRLGARRLSIDADPGAAGFYRRMGAAEVGLAPSGSIPGRLLPRLVVELAR